MWATKWVPMVGPVRLRYGLNVAIAEGRGRRCNGKAWEEEVRGWWEGMENSWEEEEDERQHQEETEWMR